MSTVEPDAPTLAVLRRCVALAGEALDAGDEPFGSVLVAPDGTVVAEERNHVGGGDHTRHPEIALARRAVEVLGPQERARAVVATSGEHCPMCAAAHAWVGLGDIVYIHSSAQLDGWRREWGLPPSPVAPLPIADVAPGLTVHGPVDELVGEMYELHRRHAGA